MTVRYINQSAVNVTWTPASDSDNYTVEGYTVYYSSVSLMKVRSRCSGSAFFNHSRESTSYGVISDLSEEYDGYEFTVLIMANNETLGNISDVTPIIALRSRAITTTTDTPTESEC